MTEQKKGTQTIESEETRKFVKLVDGSTEPIYKEIELSGGRKAQIVKGKGRHAMLAQENALDKDGKPDMKKYTASLMSQLVLIDEKGVAPEDFEDMDMKDYNKINLEFMTINF